MTILPCSCWPLAEHAIFGQNGFDASLGSVFVCINDSMPMDACFFKSPCSFHRLVESYPIALLQAFQGEAFSAAQWRCLRQNVKQMGTGIVYLRRLWTAVGSDQNARQDTRDVLQQMLNGLQAIYNDAQKTGAT